MTAKSPEAIKNTTFHTYQHIYAGANAIMQDKDKDGKFLTTIRKLTFGGAPGGTGTYVTSDPAEIEFLDELAVTSGSQITKIVLDDEGRNKVIGDTTDFKADIEAAKQDATANTLRDANPAIAAARANLGKSAAQNG